MLCSDTFQELSIETLETRGLETPGHYYDWDDALLSLTGQNTSAGITVNQLRLLQYAPMWRAVNLVARDVAKLPCNVFRVLDGGRSKEVDITHPANRLLTIAASRDQSAFDFRMYMQTMVMVHGNGFALIERDMRGAPVALVALDPMRVRAERIPMHTGPVMYRLSSETGEHVILDSSQVLHIKGLSLDGMQGLPFYQMSAESVSLGLAAQRYGSVFFRNGATPSIVLKHPNFLSDKARSRLRDGWSKFTGVSNQHKTIVLEEGVEAEPLGIDPDKAQLTELRAHEIRDAASWAGVPATKLGDRSTVSYNSLEEENRSYLAEGLDAWLCTWEAELQAKLLTERSKTQRTHTIEFTREALVRADMESRFSAYNVALQNGFMTRNEIRARENLPAMDGHDELQVPMNMGDGNATAGDDDSPEESDQEQAAED